MKDEYPKEMRHPNFTPAVLSDDNAAGRFREAPPGRPAQYPPVTVSNADQEEYHASRGYVPSNGKAHVPEPVDPRRYRERENIRMRQGEEPEVPDTYEYPKYVGDRIAKNAEEERAILAQMERSTAAVPDDLDAIMNMGPDELVEFRAWKAAEAAKHARGSTKPLRRQGEPARRKKQEMTPERLQQLRDNLAKARAARAQRQERPHGEDESRESDDGVQERVAS